MNNSIGIIGGADGPTMIMVGGNPVVSIIVIGIAALLVGAAVGFAVGYAVSRKRHK